MKLRKFDERAVTAFKKAIEFNKKHVRAHSHIAVVYDRLGLDQKATDARDMIANITIASDSDTE